MKKKILYLITKSSPYGGAQKYVYDLASEFKKRAEYDVVVACGGKGELVDKLNKEKVKVESIKSMQRDVSALKEVFAVACLFSILRRERPDIVHLNSSKAGGLGAFVARVYNLFSQKSATIVFTSHGLAFEEDRNFWQRKMILFFSWLTFFFSHKIIAISQTNKDRISRMPFMKNKVFLVHNGIMPPEFLERNSAREELFKKAGYTGDKDILVAGTIAELTKNKGYIYLLDAIGKIRDRNFVFFAISDGEEKGKLENYVRENNLQGKLFFLGYVQNASKYIKAFDVFTLTSVKEGHPYTIIEAGFGSCAVLASDISGIKDSVKNKFSGLLVPPMNTDAIANGLVFLLENEDKRKFFGDNLHTKVVSEFTIDKMIEKIENVYKRD